MTPTVSKPSDLPVGTAPLNSGVSTCSNYNAIAPETVNDDSTLYDIDTLQSTIEHSLATAALSGSQSFGQRY